MELNNEGEINSYKSKSTQINTTDKSSKQVINSNLLFETRIEREWLSTEEAAQFLSVTANALRIMVHRNQIKVYKIGRRLRFRVVDCRSLFKRKGA